MPYEPLPPSLERKDKLTPSLINALAQRLGHIHGLFLREHSASGAHDAQEIPRIVFLLTWNGSTYGITVPSGFGASIQSNYPAQLKVQLPDTAEFHRSGHPLIRAQCLALDWATNPIVTNTLVFGERWFGTNSWAWNPATSSVGPIHGATLVAVHGPRSRAVSTLAVRSNLVVSGQTLDGGLSGTWNNLARRIDELHRTIRVGHDAIGDHLPFETPRGMARVHWDGAAYSLTSTMGVIAAARQAAGFVRLTHGFNDTYIWPFVTAIPLGGAPSDVVTAGCQFASITQAIYALGVLVTAGVMDIYLWKYSPPPAHTWALTDMDFAVSIHAGS